MTERGMIFNAEMVRAILAGRKTQTRRIMAPQPEPCPRGGHWWPSNVFKTMLHVEDEMQNGKGGWGGLVGDACPFGDVGDRIWVRETFQGPLFNYEQMDEYLEDSSKFEKPEFCQYAADGGHRPEYQDADDNLRHGWRPSIHMPRWASRILLEITDVRVERLNAISQEDAQAEGMELTGWRPTYSDPDSGGEVMTPYDNFAELWSSIYGDESWKANPWVWVISFKRVEGGAA
ncbi:TPA: hypothetical protein MA383_002353 [Klebsiella pneumoniae]|uniref:hypothetical protein n=1 Tax=Klebsiella pneumoniae complex TaxID=3390273 RepID=UPI000B95AEB7|nr:hypothetical protein [Klebsiella pneumoniae]MBT1614524.1 hypothetical protein [Klebsiella pneumoniae]MDG0618948.1 hypothetical protein [Klebsiella pneumoniae]MDR7642962.1 hypothetical protein [Klebsiella pneumoniae]NVM08268.1 hypothetical protein [Klebsiella pneumoniae]OYI92581.1 hypothetical protein CI741_23995 [Klebsiella pneumoniae subsp. pneumoniae]